MGRLLGFLRRRRRREADFSEEIRAHLALEADRLAAEGLAPADAAYEARRRFGNVGMAQEEFHRRRTIGWLEDFPQQLRRAARGLVRAPVSSFTAVVTLALGIGATTAVFSLVDGVLLRPLPFAAPSRLVDLSHTIQLVGVSRVDQSDGTYLYYRRANHSFAEVGAYRTVAVNLSDRGAGEAASSERVEAARASAGVFALLGVPPLRGRVLREDEDAGTTPVVVLSERLWRTRYASDPHVVGRLVTIDGVERLVVGVMPRSFAFPDERAALWLPIGIDPARTKTAAFDYRGVARLKDGVTVAAAEADLQALLPHVPEAFPGRLTAPAIRITHLRPVVRPLRDVIVGGAGRALWVVFAAGALLLLVACANVANLFLVRAEERRHDLAVRRALGAGRGAIIAAFLYEGLLVAAVSAALGVVLAQTGLAVLRSLPSGSAIPRLAGVHLDLPVLAFAVGVTLFTALAVSVVPAARAFALPVAGVLGQTTRRATAGSGRHRAGRAFVVVQVAVALLLISAAGLMVKSFRELQAVPPGFDPAGASAFRVALPAAAYPDAGATVGFVTRALQAVATLPGVRAAGVVSKLPLAAEGRADTAVFVEDLPLAMGTMPVIHQVVWVTPGSFAALGIPFVQGRAFDLPDPMRAPLDVVVTRALARRYWGDRRAVGRRIRLSPDGPWLTVVGVTDDVRGTRLDRTPDETVFVPLVTAPGPAAMGGGAGPARWAPRDLAFVVRISGGAAGVVPTVERTLESLAPGIPVYGVRAMSDVVAQSTARTSFTLQLLEIASLAALLIGAVGLYGVASYMVSLRTREMAVRIALGARPAALQRLVLTEAVTVAAAGLALGLAAALTATRFLRALLFDVAPTDPLTLLGAVAVMAATAVIASWVPARRAAATDPATTLRGET